MKYAIDVGARIRKLRNARDWSIEYLAGRADLHTTTLQSIEVGQHSPSWKNLQKIIINGLDISPADFILSK